MANRVRYQLPAMTVEVIRPECLGLLLIPGNVSSEWNPIKLGEEPGRRVLGETGDTVRAGVILGPPDVTH